ncbi:DUF5658 family protein [Patescibacteria group bacterium]|nr:DUF5658 family protein [Patescibacteria group bacterium]
MDKKKVFVLWIVLLILSTLDIGLTLYGLRVNFISEGNPIMFYFLTEKGLAETFVFKYFGILMLLAAIILSKKISFFVYRLICVTVGLLGIVVSMHIQWLILFLVY